MIYKCICQHRPTLPRSEPRSTIGDERLNFCVRNGNRCTPFSISTNKDIQSGRGLAVNHKRYSGPKKF